MADAWTAQQNDPDLGRLTSDERLGLLVDAEWTYRERKKVERNLKLELPPKNRTRFQFA